MKKFILALLLLVITASFAVLVPAPTFAGTSNDVKAAMQLLKSKAEAKGAPTLKGEEAVAGKTVPALYFGPTEMNNNFALVDEI